MSNISLKLSDFVPEQGGERQYDKLTLPTGGRCIPHGIQGIIQGKTSRDKYLVIFVRRVYNMWLLGYTFFIQIFCS